ncbi:unnamed protein product, partial [Heterosigma akashiwo]
SLRLLLAISANKGYHVDSLDISITFLNGDIDGDVYVRQPPDFFVPEHPNKLHDHLLSQGFQRSGYKSCLYVRRDSSGGELMVAVCIDDLVISGRTSAMVSNFKRSLASKYDLTDLGELSQILGIKVTRDRRCKCFISNRPLSLKTPSRSSGLTTCLPAEPPWITPRILRLPLLSSAIFPRLTGTGLWWALWPGWLIGPDLSLPSLSSSCSFLSATLSPSTSKLLSVYFG